MTGFFKDLFNGDFPGVWQDILSAFKKLPQPVQDFIIKLESDEGQLMQQLCSVAVKDVVSGGFSTASFIAAGKDVVAQALAQGKTIGISDAIAELNIIASPLRQAAPVAPPETAPVVSAPVV